MTNTELFEPTVEDDLQNREAIGYHQAAEGYGDTVEETQSYTEKLEEFLQDTPDDVSLLPSNIRDLTAEVQSHMTTGDIGQLGWNGDKIEEIYKERAEELSKRGSENLDGARTALYEVATAIGIATAEKTRGFEANPPYSKLASSMANYEVDIRAVGNEGEQRRTAEEVIEETYEWEDEVFDLGQEIDHTEPTISMEGPGLQ